MHLQLALCFGVNGPEIMLSQQMILSSPSPNLVADLQQLILGDGSRNMLSEQFFLFTPNNNRNVRICND